MNLILNILLYAAYIALAFLALHVTVVVIAFYFLRQPLWNLNLGLAFIVDCTERMRNGESEESAVESELKEIEGTLNGLGILLHEEGMMQLKLCKEKDESGDPGSIVSIIAKIIQTKIALERKCPKKIFPQLCIKINEDYSVITKGLLSGEIAPSNLKKYRYII